MRGLTLGQEYTLTLTIIDKEEGDKEETSFTFTACKSYRQFGRVRLYNSIDIKQGKIAYVKLLIILLIHKLKIIINNY